MCCSVVVHVWYGINILCIGHFTPVDLSDRPFKTEWNYLSFSARHQRETALLIYLKSPGRYEKPIAYMFSFCWHFFFFVVSSSFKYLTSFCDSMVDLGSDLFCELSSASQKCFTLVETETFLRDGKDAPSQSLFLCGDVEEIFTKALGRGGGV